MKWNVTGDVLENTRVNGFHLKILFWCSMLMAFDGYDLVVYGSVLPSLMSEWALPAVTAGLIGSSALFGMMIGALWLGSSSDRCGRRKVILISLVVFSIATLANGFCENSTQFLVCRFFTGFGLGGLSPNIVALLAEMSPKRKRNVMVTVMLSCFSVGGVIAAVTGKIITPTFGWRANFFVAGLSLLAFPFIYRWLPESVTFLLSNGRFGEAEGMFRRLAPEFAGTVRALVSPRPESAKEHSFSRIVQLFTNGRMRDSILIWIAFGMCMFMVHGLSTWLPKLMIAHGYSVGSSLAFFATLNAGAILGGLGGGLLADRFGGKSTLVVFFLAATLSIGFLGYEHDALIQNLLLLLGGATTIGTLCIVHAFAAQFYPADIRSTGVSWAGAVGRFGAVAGPAFGGYLFSLKLPVASNFMAFALPGVIAAVAIALTAGRKSTNADSATSLTPANGAD